MRSAHILVISRLDIQHYAFQHASGKRFFAPIEEPHRVIDIGTGTGTWVLVSICTAYIIPIAYRYPHRKWPLNFPNVNSSVLTLLHYNRPLYCRKIVALNWLMYLKVRTESTSYVETPINHLLMIGIPRPDGWFDYVRQRLLVGGIPADKWKQHIQECVRVCASNGWVELIEMNGQIINGGPACQQFNTWTTGMFKSRGVDLNMVENLDELMREAGLINVTKQTFVAPFGPWGGRVGELFAEDYRLGSSSIQPVVAKVFNVPEDEIEKNCTLMMEEFKSHQAYMNVHVYLGQKQ
jgi:hypothetical protein